MFNIFHIQPSKILKLNDQKRVKIKLEIKMRETFGNILCLKAKIKSKKLK